MAQDLSKKKLYRKGANQIQLTKHGIKFRELIAKESECHALEYDVICFEYGCADNIDVYDTNVYLKTNDSDVLTYDFGDDLIKCGDIEIFMTTCEQTGRERFCISCPSCDHYLDKIGKYNKLYDDLKTEHIKLETELKTKNKIIKDLQINNKIKSCPYI